MRSRDWSLVFFTTVSQWSIGIVLWLTLLKYFSDGGMVVADPGLSLVNPVFLALLLVGAATTVSFMHLGNPSNAPNALRNLSGSWLSREILAIGIYSLSLIVAFVSGWITGETTVTKYLLLPCAISGLFLLWTMIHVYLIPTIPAWNSWYTPLSFTSTTLCLGLLMFLLPDAVDLSGTADQNNVIYFGVLATILVLEMVSGFVRQRQLAGMDTGFDGPEFRQGNYYRLFLARTALLLVTFLAVVFLMLWGDHPRGYIPVTWMYPIATLVILQAFAGRFLFYSSYFRTGI